jgi:hypothetical protein
METGKGVILELGVGKYLQQRYLQGGKLFTCDEKSHKGSFINKKAVGEVPLGSVMDTTAENSLPTQRKLRLRNGPQGEAEQVP